MGSSGTPVMRPLRLPGESGGCTKAAVNGDGEKGSKEANLATGWITRERLEVRGPYSEATAIVAMGHGSETQEAPREISM